MQRNLALDGLRGVSVLMVLLLHHNYLTLSMGWIGVDVFFALSGFLITSILRRTREDEHYWGEFWIKRGTRILPPLLLTIAIVPVFRLHSSPAELTAYIFSLGDYLAYTRPTYYTLQHLWSLAVEEHFYMVWPFAVRFMQKRSLLYLVGSLLLLESILRAAVSVGHQVWSLVYFTTPFRLDGLLLGSLLAVLFESPAKKAAVGRFSSSTIAGSVVVYMVMRVGFGLRFTSSNMLHNLVLYPLIALLCAAIVAYVLTHGESTCARLLSSQPAVFLGTISYGVYLYQLPIETMITRMTGLTNHHAFVLDFPLTVLFSWVSFTFYEQPLVSWGKRRAHALQKSVKHGATTTTMST